jgi:peptide/nickel transport system permease protein
MTGEVAAESLAPAEAGPRRIKRSYWISVRRRLARDPIAVICIAIILLMTVAAILAPWVAPMNPYKSSMIHRLQPIGSPGHLLGTDELGRDMLSRLIYGGRISLAMGILPVVASTLLGGGIGIAAGFFGGRTNMIIMRIVDVFFAFPSVLLAVAMAGVLGAGVTNCLVSLMVVLTPAVTRVAEANTTLIRKLDFIEAARATGASARRIIVGHVLSNVTGPILTFSASQVSLAIVLASGLSFLGLGVSPPLADWGLMLNTLRQSLFLAPLNAVLPGVMILLASVTFNLLSDGLRAAMDMRQ